MTKQKASWVESRRCIVCNPYISPEKREAMKGKIRAGFVRDPNNPEKWVPCMGCNNKGYNTKSGTLSS